MVVPVALQYKLKSFNSLFCDILSVISAEWCADAKTGFVLYKKLYKEQFSKINRSTHICNTYLRNGKITSFVLYKKLYKEQFSKINRSTHICYTYLRNGKKIFRKWKINQTTCFYNIHTLKNFDPENCFPRSTSQRGFTTYTH